MKTIKLSPKYFPHLFHVQSSTYVELPQNISVIKIGKPNELIKPDIDVSVFANSDIVSRIHAAIVKKGERYFIEDLKSANGTYLNHVLLHFGRLYPLKDSDCIALGKGEKVTFLFQFHQSHENEESSSIQTVKKTELLTTTLIKIGLVTLACLASVSLQYFNLASIQILASELFFSVIPKTSANKPSAVSSPSPPLSHATPPTPATKEQTEKQNQAVGVSTPKETPADTDNETMRLKNLVFTVIELKSLGKTVDNGKLFKKDAFGTWIMLSVDVQNFGNSTTYPGALTSTRFLLKDEKGNSYSPDPEGSVIYSEITNTQVADFVQLPPKAKTRIYLLFDVTSDSENFEIVIKATYLN